MTLLRKDHLTAENAERAEFFTLNSLRAHFASALSAVKKAFCSGVTNEPNRFVRIKQKKKFVLFARSGSNS
jgi:hypothetical protein